MKNLLICLGLICFATNANSQSDNLIAAAKRIMANNGYYLMDTGSCVLTEGGQCYFSESMYHGTNYSVIAVGEKGIYDLDLTATTSAGVEFAADRRSNDSGTAVVEFQKFYNDNVFFYVKNADAYNPNYMYSVTLLVGYR